VLWRTARARRSGRRRPPGSSRPSSRGWSPARLSGRTPQPERLELVSDRVEVRVARGPPAHPRIELGGAPQVFERVLAPADERLAAGEVVEDARVVGVLLESPGQDAADSKSPAVYEGSASSQDSHGEGENAFPAVPPTTSTVVSGSTAVAARRVAGSGTKTRVPAGASSSSPASVKRARPSRTTYSSSWRPAPAPSSSCSSITWRPASRAPYALTPKAAMPSGIRIGIVSSSPPKRSSSSRRTAL